jgi:hypothetical protein
MSLTSGTTEEHMWTVTARNASGLWEKADLFEIPLDGAFRSGDALSVAYSAQLSPHLVRYLEVEANPEQALSRDAIETWAKQAQEDAEAFDWAGAPRLKAIEEAIALFSDPDSSQGSGEKPLTLAWHDYAAVLIPMRADRTELRVEYIPNLSDEHRVERLRFRHASPEHELEVILDWRGYFGSKSVVIDGWTMMRRSGRGYAASFIGMSGFVVGTVLRRLTRPAATLDHDRTTRRRLIGMEQKYPHIASFCPDLSRIDQVRHDRAMVFVHGTVSCGIQGLKDLIVPRLAMPHAIYRFEHDTFAELIANAEELVSLIKNRLITKRLLLAAHSRGGLVARLAYNLLRKEGFQGEVAVFTFGTPHLGTPLVAIGTKALNLLFKLGEDIAAAAPLPLMAPLVKAYSYTVDVPTLPPGIKAMDEASVGNFRALAEPDVAQAWASNFDVNGQQSGYGVFVEGALLGALRDRQHDLVVPTESALAFGSAGPVLSCSHSSYFAEASVQQTITDFFGP